MRSWFARFVAAAALCASLLVPGAPRAQEEPFALIEEEISAWRLESARARLEGLSNAERASPKAKYVEGRLLFFEGKSEQALEALRAAIREAKTQVEWKRLRDRVESFADATARFTSAKGRFGRLVFRFEDPADERLLPYADRALGAQLKALGAFFADEPKLDVEVLVVAEPSTLASLSGLLVEQIERTGTVGVSKYGRIMLLSPRALTTGYPWIDTLCHELAHLFITRASLDKAPIWLHEGTAKLLEAAWRGRDSGEMLPEEAYLLDRAARERRLIPLRRFHPSIAALPNQEDAALAYAQAMSLAQYLGRKIGSADGVARLLRLLGEGRTIDGALEELTKFNLRRLYLWWEQEVRGTRQTPVSAVVLMQKRFKRGAADAAASFDEALSEEARKNVRLGDLLRMRGHAEAAAEEYARAEEIEGKNVPRIVERLGGALIDLRRYGEAVELLRPMTELYRAYTSGFAQLGEALARLERCDEAIEALERVVGLNPFDPSPHCLLERCYESRGKKAEAALEGDQCLALSAAMKTEGGTR